MNPTEIVSEVQKIQDPATQKVFMLLFAGVCIGGYKIIEVIIKRFFHDDADQKKRIQAIETGRELFRERYERDVRDMTKFVGETETQIKALWREHRKTKSAVQEIRSHLKAEGVNLGNVNWGPDGEEEV